MSDFGYYTFVQHSGFAFGEKEGFEQAVEVAFLLGGKRQLRSVRRAGGLVLQGGNPYDIDHELNYPYEVKGIYPRCRGAFHSTFNIDGRRLWLPDEESKRKLRSLIVEEDQHV